MTFIRNRTRTGHPFLLIPPPRTPPTILHSLSHSKIPLPTPTPTHSTPPLPLTPHPHSLSLPLPHSLSLPTPLPLTPHPTPSHSPFPTTFISLSPSSLTHSLYNFTLPRPALSEQMLRITIIFLVDKHDK